MLKLWDFESGRLLASKHAHCKSVLSLSFSADGRTLVSGGEDGVIMTWAIDVKKVD
jgi:WD40 repeat protein|tara:strand:+ start:770 stop:937 length:168 start_codon:yes stop_codon:yes gene_type:complete